MHSASYAAHGGMIYVVGSLEIYSKSENEELGDLEEEPSFYGFYGMSYI